MKPPGGEKLASYTCVRRSPILQGSLRWRYQIAGSLASPALAERETRRSVADVVLFASRA